MFFLYIVVLINLHVTVVRNHGTTAREEWHGKTFHKLEVRETDGPVGHYKGKYNQMKSKA